MLKEGIQFCCAATRLHPKGHLEVGRWGTLITTMLWPPRWTSRPQRTQTHQGLPWQRAWILVLTCDLGNVVARDGPRMHGASHPEFKLPILSTILQSGKLTIHVERGFAH